MSLPENKLLMKKTVIIIDIILQSVINCSLQYFRERGKYRNWPTVC